MAAGADITANYEIGHNLKKSIQVRDPFLALWTALSQEEGEGEGEQNECFCNNLDLAHLIWTKFGMDVQLDPRNKPTEEFFIFLFFNVKHVQARHA